MPMLKHLEIKDLALIRELSLEFEAGLNLITGETGAGKSILLDALGLALGFKAGSDLVRGGAEAARVQAAFELEAGSLKFWKAWLEEKGLPAQDGELWLKRELAASGRSRCWINGESVPAGTLSEAGDILVDFQGQHEHQALLRPRHHLGLLDEAAGLGKQVAEVAAAYEEACAARDRLKSGNLSEEDRLKRLDLLRYQVRELEEAAPKPGERAGLLEQRTLAQSAGKRREALARLHQALYGGEEGGALSQLDAAGAELARLKSMDKAWEGEEARLQSSLLELKDLGERVERAKDSLDDDPARAEKLEERLHLLERLSKKYGADEGQMLASLERARQELAGLEDHAAGRARLEADFKKALGAYAAPAHKLSAARAKAAKGLEKAVAAELAELGMPKAAFSIRLGLRQDAEGLGGRSGLDEAEFLLAANPGEDPKPLAKVASGGELSRVTLALKSGLAGRSGAEAVMVFDEVDAGISGRVAEIVGLKIGALAARQQILCVTHLPQIASRPGAHFRVEKVVKDGKTETKVERLDPARREREVAQMLAGREVTDSALSHARQLLSASGAQGPQ